MPNEALRIPEPDAGDVAHIGITTFLAAIPGVAGLGELFKFTVESSLDKRRRSWMEAVREMLLEHDQRFGQTVEELSQNENFISLLIEATQAAAKTHLDEKRKAFKNILSHGLQTGTSFDLSALYIDLVSKLNIPQIKILKLIHNEELIMEKGQGSQLSFMEQVREIIPVNDTEFYRLNFIVEELVRMGLIHHLEDHPSSPFNKPYYFLTSTGGEFLSFIGD